MLPLRTAPPDDWVGSPSGEANDVGYWHRADVQPIASRGLVPAEKQTSLRARGMSAHDPKRTLSSNQAAQLPRMAFQLLLAMITIYRAMLTGARLLQAEGPEQCRYSRQTRVARPTLPTASFSSRSSLPPSSSRPSTHGPVRWFLDRVNALLVVLMHAVVVSAEALSVLVFEEE